MQNQIRAYNFIIGILFNQQSDMLCRDCLSFAKNTEDIKKRFMEFEKAIYESKEELSNNTEKEFKRLYELIASIQEPINPVGQRKAGNCNFPQKECMVQESIKIFEKLIIS